MPDTFWAVAAFTLGTTFSLLAVWLYFTARKRRKKFVAEYERAEREQGGRL